MSTSTLSASTVNTIYQQNQKMREDGLIGTARNARRASKLDTPMNWITIAGNGILGFAGLFIVTYMALGSLGSVNLGVVSIHLPALLFGVLGGSLCIMSCTMPSRLAQMKSRSGKSLLLGACALTFVVSILTGQYSGMVILDLAENSGQDAKIAQDARSGGIDALRGIRDSARATLDVMKDGYQAAERNARVQQENVTAATNSLNDWRSSTLEKFGQGSAAANRRMGMNSEGIPTHPEHRALFDAVIDAKAERDRAAAMLPGARIKYEEALNSYKDAAKQFEEGSKEFAGGTFERKITASDSIGTAIGMSGDSVNLWFITLFTIILAIVPIMKNAADGKESEPALAEIERDKEVEALKRRVAQMTLAGQEAMAAPTPAQRDVITALDDFESDEYADDFAEQATYAPAPNTPPSIAQEAREPIAVTQAERDREAAREELKWGAHVSSAVQDFGAGKLENASIRYLSRYRVDPNGTQAGPEGAKAIQKALVREGIAEWVQHANRTECRLLRAA